MDFLNKDSLKRIAEKSERLDNIRYAKSYVKLNNRKVSHNMILFDYDANFYNLNEQYLS